MKRRFPELTKLRCSHSRARKIIVTIVILHNIAVLWNDNVPVGGIPPQEDPAGPAVPEQEYEIVEDDTEPAVMRTRCQLRD
jgi:hypothetical protein